MLCLSGFELYSRWMPLINKGFPGNFAVALDQVSWWEKWENHRRARASPFLHRLLLVNLCNRTGEETQGQNLCDKRDNNFVSKKTSLQLASL